VLYSGSEFFGFRKNKKYKSAPRAIVPANAPMATPTTAPFDKPPSPPLPLPAVVIAGEEVDVEADVEAVDDSDFVVEGLETFGSVRLYSQDFEYQASYKATSLVLHVVVEALQSGLGWEHTQLEVNSIQTFDLSKQLRAQLGIPVRSTSGFPGH